MIARASAICASVAVLSSSLAGRSGGFNRRASSLYLDASSQFSSKAWPSARLDAHTQPSAMQPALGGDRQRPLQVGHRLGDLARK